ncbi:zinc knuckle CX2CX4HX4C containing protein, partial [Tanacetum coccineum]
KRNDEDKKEVTEEIRAKKDGLDDGSGENVMEVNKGVFGNKDKGQNKSSVSDVNSKVSNDAVEPICIVLVDIDIKDYCNDANKVSSDSEKNENDGTIDKSTTEPVKKIETYVNMVRKDEVPKKLIDRPTVTNDTYIEVVVFDEFLVKKGSERWNLTASRYFVGYRIAPKELRYNIRRMCGKFMGRDIIVNNGGACLFKVRDINGLNSVIDKGPRMVNNKPLFVQKWNHEIGMQMSKHSKIPIWVRMTDVPLEA